MSAGILAEQLAAVQLNGECMPDVAVEQPITLDLLDTKTPALSATSDMPVIETKPDSVAAAMGKEPPVTEKTEPAAAPEKDAKTNPESEPADTLEQPESTSASDTPKKAQGVQKRLDELTRQAREAERREQAALDREARLLALVEGKDKPKEVEAAEPPKPKREDFADSDAYTEALIDHAATKAEWKVRAEFATKQKESEQAQQQARIAEESKKVVSSYASRVEEFRSQHSDYTEVAEAEDVRISIPMRDAIVLSENGPALAYHLGSHKEEAARIAALPPAKQFMELAKIELRLTAEPTKPVSAAPPPPRPTKAAHETPVVDPETETMDQYASRRKKEMAQGMRH